MDTLKYPIGPFEPGQILQEDTLSHWIEDISTLPDRLQGEIQTLDEKQLDVPYRQGGWTVRQVVHHLADSHINGYVRTKLALTEDVPTIKEYNQDAWAELADTQLPAAYSLNILKGLHARWTALLESIPESSFNRTVMHPESGELLLYNIIGMYAWHGNHHLGHITNLKNQKNWQ